MPPITVIRRVHPRARRLKLTFRAGQFFLTIPPRCSERSIQDFLGQSSAWCCTQLERYQKTQPVSTDVEVADFPSLNQRWYFQAGQWTEQHSSSVERVDSAHLHDQQRWIVQQAAPYLRARLAQLAAQHGFVYQSCRVSRMRSRWGSCSAASRIHLNAGLIFLSPAQVDYVLLHELCHTQQMNHSALFWQEMARVCPDYASIRSSLKTVRLPVWWLA